MYSFPLIKINNNPLNLTKKKTFTIFSFSIPTWTRIGCFWKNLLCKQIYIVLHFATFNKWTLKCWNHKMILDGINIVFYFILSFHSHVVIFNGQCFTKRHYTEYRCKVYRGIKCVRYFIVNRCTGSLSYKYTQCDQHIWLNKKEKKKCEHVDLF